MARLRPKRETLVQQADAATEKAEPFYPRRYPPAAMSLNLDKDPKPGQYTRVLGSDKVGEQMVESRQVFTVA